MPYTFVRDDDRRRVTVTESGTLTMEDAAAIMDRQANEGCWAYGFLYDARASQGTLEAAHVRALVERAQRLTAAHGLRGPVAIVTTSPAQFGMGRMYGTLSETADPAASRYEVFGDIAAAERWLEEKT